MALPEICPECGNEELAYDLPVCMDCIEDWEGGEHLDALPDLTDRDSVEAWLASC